MFLPHINVNHASTNTNSVATLDNVRAADPVPVGSVRIVTTATGYFRPGLRGIAIPTGTRRVYLGAPGHERPADIPEYTVKFDDGSGREFCQMERDFIIETVDVPRAGFLVAAAAEPVPEPEPIPARPSALSTAAADGFRETEYRCAENECALYYKRQGGGSGWRFYVYHADSDHFSCVGMPYKTRSELLADLDRYALEYGFPAIPRAAFLNAAEPAADPEPAEPTTEPEPVASAAEQVAARPAAFLTRDSADDTFEDFEQREFYVLEFGRTLEADRVATIQGNRYAIEPRPDSSGFQIQVTGADGFTETICSGFYGFAFDTFDRTVSYAVQRVRERYVVHPERLCSNGGKTD